MFEDFVLSLMSMSSSSTGQTMMAWLGSLMVDGIVGGRRPLDMGHLIGDRV